MKPEEFLKTTLTDIKVKLTDEFDKNFERKAFFNENLINFVFMGVTQNTAKPFVKWAGGKTQLIKDIDRQISLNTHTYIEPFVGGGALLFYLFL